MAKRKVDAENRRFQTRWEAEYMFTEVKGKPVCLLCGESLAVMKEYNLRRHHETSQKHTDKDKYKNMYIYNIIFLYYILYNFIVFYLDLFFS